MANGSYPRIGELDSSSSRPCSTNWFPVGIHQFSCPNQAFKKGQGFSFSLVFRAPGTKTPFSPTKRPMGTKHKPPFSPIQKRNKRGSLGYQAPPFSPPKGPKNGSDWSPLGPRAATRATLGPPGGRWEEVAAHLPSHRAGLRNSRLARCCCFFFRSRLFFLCFIDLLGVTSHLAIPPRPSK